MVTESGSGTSFSRAGMARVEAHWKVSHQTVMFAASL